jgi:hypothetical protein
VLNTVGVIGIARCPADDFGMPIVPHSSARWRTVIVDDRRVARDEPDADPPFEAVAPGERVSALQPFIDHIVKLIYRFGLMTGLEVYLFANQLSKPSIAWWKTRTSENLTIN